MKRHNKSRIVSIVVSAGLLIFGVAAANIKANDYQLEPRGSWVMSAGTGSDVWGWTAPDGTEYALYGYRNGIAVIQTTGTVALRATVPGPTGNGGFIWRDIKTYQNYCYSVSEATGSYSGIGVFDLSCQTVSISSDIFQPMEQTDALRTASISMKPKGSHMSRATRRRNRLEFWTCPILRIRLS